MMQDRTLFREGELCVVVVAHPDDEAMFFYPTVRLASAGALAVVSLSNGGADGLGAVRAVEMALAAERLGADVAVVDDARLRDGPLEAWASGAVAEVVAARVERFAAALGGGTDVAIVTFDEWGASGHANHVATSRGVARLLADADLRATMPSVRHTRGLALKTRGVARRFLGPVDALLALLAGALAAGRREPGEAVLVNASPLGAWRAMQAHTSQFVWYRRLFVLFSSYAYANTIGPLPLPAGLRASSSSTHCPL